MIFLMIFTKIWRIRNEKDGVYDTEDQGGEGKSKKWLYGIELFLNLTCVLLIYDPEFLIDQLCNYFPVLGSFLGLNTKVSGSVAKKGLITTGGVSSTGNVSGTKGGSSGGSSKSEKSGSGGSADKDTKAITG
jgi:hypothetical protein